MTKPLLDSIPARVDVPSRAVASFDFFELFAIYFCFGSAKPTRQARMRKRKRHEKSSCGNSTNLTMRHFVFRWAITTVAVLVAASVISGIRYDSVGSLIGAALLLGILNAFCVPFCFS